MSYQVTYPGHVPHDAAIVVVTALNTNPLMVEYERTRLSEAEDSGVQALLCSISDHVPCDQNA